MSKGWAGVARFGGLGDNLIAAATFAPLKRLGYMVEMISAEPTHVVYLHNPNIDKLSIKVPERDVPQGDMVKWQQWFDGRSHEYDLFANLSHSCEVRHSLFDGSTPFYWPAAYRRKLCAGNYLETACEIMGIQYEPSPLYYASDEEKQRAGETKEKIGKRCIGWVLNGSRIDKVYPWSTYAIGRLLNEIGPVVVFGGGSAKEHAMGQTIIDYVESVRGDLKGLHSAMSKPGVPDGEEFSWPIRRSLALLQTCDVVVTVDTGPAWAIAFEPMGKVMLHSHGSMENVTKHWVNTISLHANTMRVPCWPCHRLHNEPRTCVVNKEGNGAACISDISVEQIVSSVKKLWK